MLDFYKNDDLGRLVLRLTVGILMLFHGVGKIIHSESLGFIKDKLALTGLPSELAYGVYLGEVVAPLLIIIGVFCRWGGLILVVNMLFAIVLVHMGEVFTLTEQGGYRLELQAFYLFCGLAVISLGSGKYAVKPD